MKLFQTWMVWDRSVGLPRMLCTFEAKGGKGGKGYLKKKEQKKMSTTNRSCFLSFMYLHYPTLGAVSAVIVGRYSMGERLINLLIGRGDN